MRIIKSIAIHKRTQSEQAPSKSAIIDKAYDDIFAPDNPINNVNLKRLSSNWALSHSRLVQDFSLIQSQLLLERERSACLQRQCLFQSEFLADMKRSLARHEQLIAILSEIGLCDDVVSNAHTLLSGGETPIDALVSAIREAASVPGSTWAVILSAVVGPRTEAEYAAALNISLNARKELRKCKKIAKYWKKLALRQPPQISGFVTPSVSALSSVYEKLPPERQIAVNVLLARREKEKKNTSVKELSTTSMLGNISRPVVPNFVSYNPLHGSRYASTSTQDSFAASKLPPRISLHLRQERVGTAAFLGSPMAISIRKDGTSVANSEYKSNLRFQFCIMLSCIVDHLALQSRGT